MSIWKLIDTIVLAKHMVRFAAWPGGNRTLSIYVGNKQHLYNGSFEEIEVAVLKDFGHLLSTPKPSLPKLPPLPGLPKL